MDAVHVCGTRTHYAWVPAFLFVNDLGHGYLISKFPLKTESCGRDEIWHPMIPYADLAAAQLSLIGKR